LGNGERDSTLDHNTPTVQSGSHSRGRSLDKLAPSAIRSWPLCRNRTSVRRTLCAVAAEPDRGLARDRPVSRKKHLLIKVVVLAQNPARLARRSKPVAGVEAMAMQRLNRIALRMIAMAALAQAMGACSSDLSLNNVTLVPKPETLLRKPDWANFSGGKNDFELRPVTAADLVGPEGQCGSGPQAAGVADPTGAGATPPVAGGMSLQMTECDVVRRAGPVEKIDFGANDRGERAVTLTYLRGSWPGVYRFVGGRLVSIERAPGPPPAPAKPQKATTKKPAGT
jgi:hypothetical protein